MVQKHVGYRNLGVSLSRSLSRSLSGILCGNLRGSCRGALAASASAALAFFGTSCLSRKLDAQTYKAKGDALEAFPESASALAEMLEIDRLAVYIQENAHRIKKGDKLGPEHPIVKTMETLLPKKISEIKELSAALRTDDPEIHLKRVQSYDSLIQAITGPHELLNWKYEFRKRKYSEAFLYKTPALKFTNFEPALPDLTRNDFVESKVIAELSTPQERDFVFPAENYVADRMTRATFWFVNHLGRKIEFHIGQVSDFNEDLAARQGRVLAEIVPFAQNYNKIYLVKYPNEPEPVVAITRISGQERLDHLIMHLPIAELSLPSQRYSGQYTIHGNAQNFLEERERELQLWLERQPTADMVVIGQKGAVESLFESAEKMQFINEAAALPETLDSAELKKLSKIKERFTQTRSYFHTDLIPDVRSLYKKIAGTDEERADYKDAELENNMYAMTDLLYQEKDTKKKKRLRVFSNVWGDEITPIVKALSATGHKRLVYIGTAGGIPDPKDPQAVQVGDLVIGRTFYDKDLNESSKVMDLTDDPLPKFSSWKKERIKSNGKIADVVSPLAETKSWLQKMQEKGVTAVEVETYHLAKVLNETGWNIKGSGKDFSVYLLISDVVATEHTLDAAQSADREQARTEAFEQLLREINAESIARDDDSEKGKNSTKEATMKLFASSDDSFKYHAFQLATLGEKTPQTAQEVEEFFTANGYFDPSTRKAIAKKSFSDSLLEERLMPAGELIWLLRENGALKDTAKVALPKAFVQGLWNPKIDKLEMAVVATSEQASQAAREIINQWLAKAKATGGLEKVDIVATKPQGFVAIALKDFAETYSNLINLYAEGAYLFGGFLKAETASGRLKFFDSNNQLSLEKCPKVAKFCNADFF